MEKTKELNWIVTDGSTGQRMKRLSERHFLFEENRVINPETKETELYEGEINLDEFTEEEMYYYVEPYGYSFEEMKGWITSGKDLNIIAECIFEMMY